MAIRSVGVVVALVVGLAATSAMATKLRVAGSWDQSLSTRGSNHIDYDPTGPIEVSGDGSEEVENDVSPNPIRGGEYFSRADFGVLQSEANAHSSIEPATEDEFPTSDRIVASSVTSFEDTFFIGASGFAGVGTADFLLDIDGTLEQEGDGYASVFASLFVRADEAGGGSNTFLDELDMATPGQDFADETGLGPISRTLIVSVTFDFGEDIFLFGQLTTTARVDTFSNPTEPGQTNSGEMTAAFGSTASWGGIVNVRDSSGNPVTDFTVTSDSGTDYSQAIPEPTSAALLAVFGLGLLVSGRGAKNRTPATC